jgi:hypothetical protein
VRETFSVNGVSATVNVGTASEWSYREALQPDGSAIAIADAPQVT